MPDYLVQGRKLYVGGRDLSGDWTAISLKAGREAIDFTRGSDSVRTSKPGLRVVALEAEGIVNLGADLADEELTAAMDLTAVPIIVAPTNGASGEPAWAFRAQVGDYEPFADAKVGERLNFRVSARANTGKLVRSTIMEDGFTSRVASGSSTVRQLGAVPSGQKLYACVMCTNASVSDTLDVIVRSDDNAGMSSPTTRATFTQLTAAGTYDWREVAGPITDSYFDVSWTIGGTSPSFNFVVVLAIA